MPKRKLNVRMLRRIQRQILKEPRQFDMASYYLTASTIPNCQTAACIAGWTVALDGKLTPAQASQKRIDYWLRARRILGITHAEAHQLFLASHWPEPFYSRYRRSSSLTKRNARVAVARIEHFIKTGE